jgi:predicted dehydrogenase
VLCTPPSVREDVVAAALENGIAVLVEKPLAESEAHARRMMELAAAFPDVVTASAYCHRFTPAVREMMRRAESGDIGRVVRWENVFACSIPDMGDRWMSDPAVSGGGSLIDTGCHSLDLFQYMQGGLEPVAAVFDRNWAGRGESGATSLVRSPATGVAGVIMNGWLEPARFLVTLVGEEGLLTYDYEKPTELFRTSVAGERSTIEVETHDVRFARQLEAFVDAVAGAARDENLATFADGLAVAQAVESLAGSAR